MVKACEIHCYMSLCACFRKKKFSIHYFIDSTYPTTTNKSNKVTHSLLHSGVLQEARLLRTERRFSINCQLFLHSLSTILSVKCSSPEYTGSTRKPMFMPPQCTNQGARRVASWDCRLAVSIACYKVQLTVE